MEENINLTNALKKYFGFDTFKGNQEAIIRNLLAGNDTFVLMPTGGGKSLCYQLPSLIMEGTAIVISPLIALMKNQVDAMRNFSEEDGVAHFINSSLNKSAIDQVKSDILSGKTKLLYVAPESLTKEENVEFLRGVKISFYAVDEAHCISEWGHDFRPEYRRIRPIINEIGKAPVIALTATATPKVRMDIQKNLGMLDAAEFKSSFNRPNLYYEVRPKTNNIDRDIIKFIKANSGKSGIIYCLSRKKVEELAEILQANGINARAYHAGMDSATRTANQDGFLKEDIDVIVATIAFGMGIDKPDVRFVIHYDIPKSLEGYYQETGRAGRDGGEGMCITFYSNKDLQKLEKFMQGKPVAEQEIGKQLLLETAAYAESSVCRRKSLLHYFGEEFTEDNCGNCDNCLNPKKQVEAQDSLCAVIETIIAVKENFKADYIIDILLGKETTEVLAHKHEELEVFGSGMGEEDKTWNAVIRQALIAGYLSKDVENYGLLKVTSAGHKFLKNPKSFKIVEDNDFEEEEEETPVRKQNKIPENIISQAVIENAIIEIVIENDDKGRPTGLGEIGSRLQKKYSDFDVRNYGYSSLSTFIEEIDNFDLQKVNNTVIVRLKEDNGNKKQVTDFAIACVREAGSRGVELAALGQKIHVKYPGFKAKEYGYSTLSKFISSIKVLKIESVHENRKMVYIKGNER